MKKLLFLLLLLPTCLFSQTEIQVVDSFSLSKHSVWYADLLGNVYIAEKDNLVKYDTTGTKQYSQSIKSIGGIRSILSINTLRLVLFSEQQQTFTIIDNTLTSAAKTYDLSELGFGYVAEMTVSSQPNKFWIYDQSSSRLVLIDLNRTNQQQEIENVRGILNATEVIWMKEDNNKLYLFDSKNQLYIFDAYGSLLDVIELKEVQSVEVFHSEIFVLKPSGVYRYRSEDQSLEKVVFDQDSILEFQWTNDTFFVRSDQKLFKYQF